MPNDFAHGPMHNDFAHVGLPETRLTAGGIFLPATPAPHAWLKLKGEPAQVLLETPTEVMRRWRAFQLRVQGWEAEERIGEVCCDPEARCDPRRRHRYHSQYREDESDADEDRWRRRESLGLILLKGDDPEAAQQRDDKHPLTHAAPQPHDAGAPAGLPSSASFKDGCPPCQVIAPMITKV